MLNVKNHNNIVSWPKYRNSIVYCIVTSAAISDAMVHSFMLNHSVRPPTVQSAHVNVSFSFNFQKLLIALQNAHPLYIHVRRTSMEPIRDPLEPISTGYINRRIEGKLKLQLDNGQR